MSQVILLMRDRASTRPLRFLWGLSISIVGLSVVLQSVGSGLLAAWLQLESSAAQALQAALFAGGLLDLVLWVSWYQSVAPTPRKRLDFSRCLPGLCFRPRFCRYSCPPHA